MRGDPRKAWLSPAALELLEAAESVRRIKRRAADFDNAELLRVLHDAGKRKQLKESDKRKFREQVRSAFSPALDSADALDAVMGTRQSTMAVAKLGATHHTVYWVDDNAVFLQQEQKGKKADDAQLVPTPYTLRKCPHMLRQLAVLAPVRKNICRGADLFSIGVVGASDLTEGRDWALELLGGHANKGELVALVAYDNGVAHAAPFAVGRFARTDGDMVEEGLRGCAVEVLLRLGDALCGGDASEADAAAPPAVSVGAAEGAAASGAATAAYRGALQTDRAGAQAAVAAALQQIEDVSDKKKAEKLLRQIDDLRGKSGLNADQQGKLDKEPLLRRQLADISERQAALALVEYGLPDAPSDDAAEAPRDGAATDVPCDATAEGADGATADPTEEGAADDDEDDRGDEDPGEDPGDDASEQGDESTVDDADPVDVDGLFVDAFFTTLRRDLKLPCLASEVFSGAAKLAGAAVKETRWKKAAAFLAEFPCLATRERSRGVTEVATVSWAAAPAWHEVKAAPAGEDALAALKATKRGGAVIIATRKVRNKNCTFIDGLDSWGFTQESSKLLANRFQKKFSAAASVHVRKGTEGNGKKQLWSIMVQGKYAHQAADALRKDHGVANVTVQGSSNGIITKKDKAANV
ncbi:hypothetical protein M885DRAFT_612057 [Pelagophyceae sp. CCMP2097]|nr:hypothetical protein M885DRAFT_612057 [Pelagophyceae sp. CCMP2097]